MSKETVVEIKQVFVVHLSDTEIVSVEATSSEEAIKLAKAKKGTK